MLNNILYRHLFNFISPAGVSKYAKMVIPIIFDCSIIKPGGVKPTQDTSTATLIGRLRSFQIRENDKLRPKQNQHINRLVVRLESLQRLQDQPKAESNEDLLKQIKALEMRVKANSVSPSGHALSLPTKIAFNNLVEAITDVLQAPSAELFMVLSQDRLRILRADLVYLVKREHIFHNPKLT